MVIMHVIPSWLLVTQWFEHSSLWVQDLALHTQENVKTARPKAIVGKKNRYFNLLV